MNQEIVMRKSEEGYLLEAVIWLPRPVAEVFEFFADALNLEQLTPPFLRFRVTTPAPIDMAQGTLIDYRLRIHGFPIRWRTRISRWEPPYLFVDEMLRGPYRWWHHTHTFEEWDGGTLVRDQVRYGVPGGALTNRLFVGADVRRIFEFRQRTLRAFFATRETAAA